MFHNRLAKGICTICICFLQINTIKAQGSPGSAETLHLDMKQAEKMFLVKNLSLLAEYYNIKSSEALVEQARKWDNPILNTDQNVYSNNKFFEHGTDANGNPQGQIYVQVQQLIKTAGKRGKQIDLAKTNVSLANWQFKSTMRSQRATLIKDFYTIAQLQSVAQLHSQNQQQLDKLLPGMKAQLDAGNIAKKEYLRVQALQVALQQDMVENAKDINDAEADLKTLLQITGDTIIVPTNGETENTEAPALTLVQLTDSARKNNTDYQQQIYQLQYQRQNLSLQKSLAVPDITLGPEFDQNSNYAPNYAGLAISLPIPLWDRNRGNIKSARFQVKQQEAGMLQADQKLQNDVMNAYQKLMYSIHLASGSNADFYKDYYQLYQNVVNSYNNRQIGLIEFLDYFNDYCSTRQNQLQQILNLRLAKEDLNEVVGVDVAQ